jgi:very-short-patch-repair endonuclease
MDRETRTERSRDLRQRQTYAENKLWQAIRGGRLDGLKFRRQHPIGSYFADFACEKARLVIELDGGIHEDDDQASYDLIRQREIESLGWLVLRFVNDEVVKDLPKVLDAVKTQARMADTVTPSPSHSTSLSGSLPLPMGEG